MAQTIDVVGFVIAIYGLFAIIAFTNLILMRRLQAPKPGAKVDLEDWVVLIPARDEAENLAVLLPLLKGAKVVVFDDESSDGTGKIARRLGATVITPTDPLPAGWTGKNRACHELGTYALTRTTAQWLLFLDADARPQPLFLASLTQTADRLPQTSDVITGFPHVVPGRGIQPLFLAWVGWILLSTNPYGLVNRSRKGHSRFTNGQVHAWRREVYANLLPNETVRKNILEDVMIGRLCARQGVHVEVLNMSRYLHVKMYETWQETLDGMSKNSYEITGSLWGSTALAGFLLVLGWGWVVFGASGLIGYGLLVLSAVLCSLIVNGKPWGAFLMPIVLTIGSITILRSAIWRMRGTVRWKGRYYPPA